MAASPHLPCVHLPEAFGRRPGLPDLMPSTPSFLSRLLLAWLLAATLSSLPAFGATPLDLPELDALVVGHCDVTDGDTIRVRVDGQLAFNDGDLILDAARSGLGIAYLPDDHVDQDIAKGKLVRVLTPDLQQRLDPFLMLDHFGSDDPKDYGAGFPDHPHRGFETVTYMIAGRMRHKDSAGHEGLLQNGGVQWMTAGRGLVHSEMPEQEEGVMEGFQLWLNLPGKDKLCAPWYRDIQSADIPEFQTAEGVTVRVIAGESVGPQGPVAGSMRRPASA